VDDHSTTSAASYEATRVKDCSPTYGIAELTDLTLMSTDGSRFAVHSQLVSMRSEVILAFTKTLLVVGLRRMVLPHTAAEIITFLDAVYCAPDQTWETSATWVEHWTLARMCHSLGAADMLRRCDRRMSKRLKEMSIHPPKEQGTVAALMVDTVKRAEALGLPTLYEMALMTLMQLQQQAHVITDQDWKELTPSSQLRLYHSAVSCMSTNACKGCGFTADGLAGRNTFAVGDSVRALWSANSCKLFKATVTAVHKKADLVTGYDLRYEDNDKKKNAPPCSVYGAITTL
jgi:hypothetical protein